MSQKEKFRTDPTVGGGSRASSMNSIIAYPSPVWPVSLPLLSGLGNDSFPLFNVVSVKKYSSPNL